MDEKEERSFEDMIRMMFSAPITSTAFFKDFPRLLSRLTLHTSSGCDVGPFGDDWRVEEGGEEKGESIGNHHKVVRVNFILSLLSIELEPEDEQEDWEEVRKEGEIYAMENDKEEEGDLMLIIPPLFEIYGLESKAVKCLKLINQNIILHCMFLLKQSILKDTLTKDVRGPEGWRVHINMFEQGEEAMVQLTHTRREQSVTESFFVEWTVSATFDRCVSLTICQNLSELKKKKIHNISK